MDKTTGNAWDLVTLFDVKINFKVGDRVTIDPRYSMAFGCKEGEIVEFNDSPLPYCVQFNKDENSYNFYYDELIPKWSVDEWKSYGTVLCIDCGQDITGFFTFICENCQYPVPEGD